MNVIYPNNMRKTPKESFKKFGAKVREYRILAGLTQEQLAERCKCTSQTISGIETGYNFASSPLLFVLPKALDIPLVYLFNYEKEEELSKNEDIKALEKIFFKMDEQQRKIALKILKALVD